MTYKLILSPRAELEVEDAIEWYQSRQKGLGIRFLNILNIQLQKIEKHPLHYPNKEKGFHECVLDKFPFLIIYKVIHNKIVIYSIFNTYRNPIKKPK